MYSNCWFVLDLLLLFCCLSNDMAEWVVRGFRNNKMCSVVNNSDHLN